MNKINLNLNEIVTILKPMDLVPSKVTGRIKGYYFSSYAQHKNALYIYIQRPRARKLDRVVILPTDTAFIFKGKFEECWRKEETSNRENLLHRITYNDVKENKNLLYSHLYGEEFTINNNLEYFLDSTGDFMMYNNIRAKEADTNESYINYIKELSQNFNIGKIKELCKNEGYTVLLNCINKAVQYNW